LTTCSFDPNGCEASVWVAALVVGDRGYAKPPGLQHVLAAGADFLVRVGWNSMRMITPDGARLNLAAIYDTLESIRIYGVSGCGG